MGKYLLNSTKYYISKGSSTNDATQILLNFTQNYSILLNLDQFYLTLLNLTQFNSTLPNYIFPFQKLLEQLNNDVQNISAKASSNKLINGQNLDEINKLKQEITQMKIHQTTGSISNNSPDLNTTSSTKTTLITP